MKSTDAKSMQAWPLEPVIDWLLDEGRFLPAIETLTVGLAERLVASGAPVSRLRVSVRLLHPLVAAMSAVWEQGGAPAKSIPAAHGLEQRAGYLGSPLEHIARTRQPFRRRLADGLTPDDHAVLHEVAAAGATDYLALPMRFSTGLYGSLTIATDRAGGFDDRDIAQVRQLTRVLAPIVEARVSLRLAETLADTYIGPRSGRRVLEGRIRRGDVETLRAAIWFSDIRGWTRIANERPADEAVAVANAYFERVDAAIRARGGEVLKLIGDAVLAIFPAEGDGAAACRAAIAAAQQALAPAEAVPDAAGARCEFGIGLHLGEVVYGNVGSETRLDFTVMGRAVNFAARIETLTRSLGVPLVLSEELARASGVPLHDLGAHAVAGWDAPVRLFAPGT